MQQSLLLLGENKEPHVPRRGCYCKFKKYSKVSYFLNINLSLYHNWKKSLNYFIIASLNISGVYEHSALTSRGMVLGTMERIDGQSHRALVCDYEVNRFSKWMPWQDA